jgi:uncharacterized protein DUF3761
MKKIQLLCAASLALGTCLVASPGAAAAQVTTQTVEKVGPHKVVTTTQTRTGDRVITRTRTTRTRALCEDGTWSYTHCVNHGGLAARQYTPRASEVAVLHANEHSAVVRAYANRVRTRAVARCNDGTYWHATNHVRACYAHGGVARWY